MFDPFEDRTPSAQGPANDLAPVTPSDSTDLPSVAIALYVETGGALSFVSQAGESRTVALADFAILPVGVRRVMATGTTAASIHAFVVG